MLTRYPYLVTEYGHALIFDVSSANNSDTLPDSNSIMLDLNRPTSEHVSKFQDDISPISLTCSCYCCRMKFSKAYIVHLLNTHEMLAKVLLMW